MFVAKRRSARSMQLMVFAFPTALACLAQCLAPALVLAQEPADPEESTAPAEGDEGDPEPQRKINLTGQPRIDLAQPPPGEPVGRTFHQHEGFYLRLNAGLGTLLGASLDLGGAEFSSGGLTLGFDALAGFGPAPGLTLGAALVGNLQLSGEWEADGLGLGSTGGSLATFMIGPFVDGFPDSKGGLHFGGMVGLANASFDSPGDDSESALGFGGAFWVGKDVWVAPEWSLGGQLRLDALRATDDNEGADVTVTAIGLSIMFTVLYN